MILKYFRQKIAKKLALLTQNKAKLCKILIITFFRRKLSKIAENCDHNIDPWLNNSLPNAEGGCSHFPISL
jgi:hypothetical protein